MICQADISPSQGSYVLEVGSVLDRDCDVIDLVYRHTIRAPSRAFVDSLVGEDGTTYHQPMPLAAVNKSCSVIISDSDAMISNHTAIPLAVASDFGIHVSHKHYCITRWYIVQNRFQLAVRDAFTPVSAISVGA